jgi:hypothetical protein
VLAAGIKPGKLLQRFGRASSRFPNAWGEASSCLSRSVCAGGWRRSRDQGASRPTAAWRSQGRLVEGRLGPGGSRSVPRRSLRLAAFYLVRRTPIAWSAHLPCARCARRPLVEVLRSAGPLRATTSGLSGPRLGCGSDSKGTPDGRQVVRPSPQPTVRPLSIALVLEDLKNFEPWVLGFEAAYQMGLAVGPTSPAYQRAYRMALAVFAMAAFLPMG